MKRLFLEITALNHKFTFCLFVFAFALLSVPPTVAAQTLFGETIQTMKFRLEQDTSLLPQLAVRFAEGDTTLNINQLSLLYYGYAINAEHNAQSESRILDAASSLGRREKFEDAINLLDNFLEKNPGSLAALLERAYTSWLVNDSLGTVNGYKKYYQLMEVPMQSGTGANLKSPIVVSSVRDMELVMDKKGYFIKSQSLLNRNGHKIYMLTCATEAEPDAKKYFYFNVDLPLGNR
ncbi:MAG: DUF4919 domain-containing protein [Bacteroidota bacterium]